MNAACSPYASTTAPASPSWECCGPRSSPKERERERWREVPESVRSYYARDLNVRQQQLPTGITSAVLSFFPRTTSRSQVGLTVMLSSEPALVVVTERLRAAILHNLLAALDAVGHKTLPSVLTRFRIRKAGGLLATWRDGHDRRQTLSRCPTRLGPFLFSIHITFLYHLHS